jgi:RNA polymerase sigma-70 factor (ECF subfamily)
MNRPRLQPDLARCLLRIAGGDRTAFSELYDETVGQLYGLALGICRRRSLADDVVQEAYVRIWRHAHRYDPGRGEPMAWLATIVRRLSIDALRRAGMETQLEPEVETEVPDPDGDPLGHAIRARDTSVIRRCLVELEPRQRTCILLAYYKGYSHSEIGARLGLPLGTVKSHVRRGLQRLKRCIES